MVNTRDVSDLLLAIHNCKRKEHSLLNLVQTTSITTKGNIRYRYSIEFYHKEKNDNGKVINVVDGREYFSKRDELYQYLGNYYKALVGDS